MKLVFKESVEAVNLCLDVIGESQKKLQQVKYLNDKIRWAVKRKILPEKQEVSDEAEILKQLRDKFDISSNRNEKVQLLIVLPKSWSIWRDRNSIFLPGIVWLISSDSNKL